MSPRVAPVMRTVAMWQSLPHGMVCHNREVAEDLRERFVRAVNDVRCAPACAGHGIDRSAGSDEDDVTLGVLHEHGVAERNLLEEPREARHDVGARDHDEVGAVTHLGERRRDPAAFLQREDVAHQRATGKMVDDAAHAIGKLEHGADARDVGCESAEGRLHGLTQDRGSLVDRPLERHGVPGNPCLTRSPR